MLQIKLISVIFYVVLEPFNRRHCTILIDSDVAMRPLATNQGNSVTKIFRVVSKSNEVKSIVTLNTTIFLQVKYFTNTIFCYIFL